LARIAGIQKLLRLHASFAVTRHGRDGLHVTGSVSAVVRQTCVVTLEPLDNDVEEQVDLVFRPPLVTAATADLTALLDAPGEAAAGPEPLVDGTLDLGAIATEFLVLGIDPYPRKPGAVFAPAEPTDAGDNPFAALTTLSKAGGTEGS
jgi:hypothetical protein